MKAKEVRYFMMGMALFLLGISNVHATTVLEDFQVVTGDFLKTTPFEVEQAGIYEATLVDFEFPVAFDILALGITTDITQNFTPLGIGFGTGSFIFKVTSPGTLLAHLVASPGDPLIEGDPRRGTYGLQIKAIPIPPAAILLFSGLMGLVLVGRRSNGLRIA